MHGNNGLFLWEQAKKLHRAVQDNLHQIVCFASKAVEQAVRLLHRVVRNSLRGVQTKWKCNLVERHDMQPKQKHDIQADFIGFMVIGMLGDQLVERA